MRRDERHAGRPRERFAANRWRSEIARWRSALVEPLEARALLAVVAWDGGGDGTSWNSAANWVGDALPGPADDVQITGAGGAISLTAAAGYQRVNSVASDRALNVSGGTLDVNTSLVVNNTLTVTGTGRLSNALVLPGTGAASFAATGGTLDHLHVQTNVSVSGGVVVSNDLTLDASLTLTSSSLVFLGSQALNGTGHVYLAGGNLLVQGGGTAGTAATLTVGSGVSVHASQNASFTPFYSAFDQIDNQGSILADTASRTLNVTLAQNSGTVAASGGTLNLAFAAGFTNTGTLQVTAGTLSVSTGTVAWASTGTLAISAGTLNLAGAFTQAGLGSFSRTGGTVNIVGTLTGNLALDATTGSVNLGLGGRLLAGTYTATGGAALSMTGISTTLDQYTLNNPVTASSSVTVTGGLGLNARLTLNSSVVANFSGTQTLSGTGDVFFAGSSASVRALGTGTAPGAATLTIGPGITVHGGGSTAATVTAVNTAFDRIVNQGTIDANTASTSITVAYFTNQGTLRASAGTLSVGTGTVAWTNAGTLAISAGTLNLAGAFTQAGLGTFSRTGGTVNIVGTLTGNLALDAATGSINLTAAPLGSSGKLSAGTLTTTGGAVLAITSSTTAPTLDQYTLNAPVTATGSFTVTGGLTLGARLSLSSSVVATFAGTQALLGTGDVFFTGSSATVRASGSATLTIGPSVTVHGNTSGSVTVANTALDRVINQGTIVADSGTNAITVSYVDNQGLIESNLGTVNLTSGWTSTGTLRATAGTMTVGTGTSPWSVAGSFLVNGGTVNLAGALTQASLGTYARTGGTVNLVGTLTGNLAVNAATPEARRSRRLICFVIALVVFAAAAFMQRRPWLRAWPA